ncbi:ABC transporter substrate-binding protein [uncultured Microbacterium sp.]|uniref:ABC transporter substrate-binding protein n=1 Tax=uncultured Microbacterium sp. TaxID=191216 RepID=UPI0035CC82E7
MLRYVGLAVGAVLVASTAACSASSADTGSIRVAVTYPDVWGEPMKAAAKLYEEAHPGTEIKIEELPADSADDSLQTSFIGGAAPDLVQLSPPTLTDFGGRGFLEPLTTILDENAEGGAPWRESFTGTTLPSLRAQNGEEYGIPWSQINVQLLTRADSLAAIGLDAPPATWDESLKANDAWLAKGIQPLYAGFAGNDGALWWRTTLMLNALFRPYTEDINLLHADGWTYDSSNPDTVAGEVYSADELYVAFKKGITDPAKSPEYRKAIELMLQLKPAVQSDVASWTPEESHNKFDRGEVAQGYGLASDIAARVKASEDAGLGTPTLVQSNFPTITKEDWPGLTEGGSNPLASVRFAWSVNAASKDKTLAEDFLKFITQPEVTTKIYAAGFFPEDGTYGIGDTTAIDGVVYPEGSNLDPTPVETIPELTVYGFGLPPTYDTQDFDQWNSQFLNLWTGVITLDEFLAQRSESNLAALTRNLDVFAADIDQKFIDENTK